MWSPIPRSGPSRRPASRPTRSSNWPGGRGQSSRRWSSITVIGSRITPMRYEHTPFHDHPQCLDGPQSRPRVAYFSKKRPRTPAAVNIARYSAQVFPKISQPRFDGAGRAAFPIINAFHGNVEQLAHAILDQDPYPIKALIANRFDPLASIRTPPPPAGPGSTGPRRRPGGQLRSETAWYADVILPESIYLERSDCIQLVTGLKPCSTCAGRR